MNPTTIHKLQNAVRRNDVGPYREYAQAINDQSRELLHDPRPAALQGGRARRSRSRRSSPRRSIMKRFCTGAMSFGSISAEAHETLAIAMNRIGGKSNSGEGGEDPQALRSATRTATGGAARSSRSRRAASACRAGTWSTPTSCRSRSRRAPSPAKAASCPATRSNRDIARVRNSTPGVGLISPPPHHDIYSIEDLAQLIHDLKNANPKADISVKLVSVTGVGTIAAGVSKGHAESVQIAGFEGGTGASPLTSIKHAGVPWEIGLAETQQALVMNDLRGRIRVHVDGQLRTGRDVVIGAMLGADEFGFGTIALVALGCILMRVCHLNTCPVGVATQNAELRKKFTGKPEHVVHFFRFVAEETREILAELGFRKLDDVIGRIDLRRGRPDDPPLEAARTASTGARSCTGPTPPLRGRGDAPASAASSTGSRRRSTSS